MLGGTRRFAALAVAFALAGAIVVWAFGTSSRAPSTGETAEGGAADAPVDVGSDRGTLRADSRAADRARGRGVASAAPLDGPGRIEGTIQRARKPVSARVAAWHSTASRSEANSETFDEPIRCLGGAPPDVEVATDSRGRYVLERLSLGTWYVRATGDAGPACWAATEAPPDRTAILNLVLREGGSALAVLAVHADGTAFRGWLTLDDPLREVSRLVPLGTDPTGRVRFEGLADGSARLVAANPGAFRSPTFDVLLPRTEELRVVVDGPTRVVRGQVVDADGRPVSGAIVDATDAAGGFVVSGGADARGDFSVTCSARAVTLTAHADGFVDADTAVPETSTEPTTIVLRRPARVHGVVREAGTGRVVAAVPVGYTTYSYPVPATKTDADGRYALEDLRPGEIVVVVCGEGWFAKDLEDAGWSGFDPYAIALRAGEDRILDVEVVRSARLEGVDSDAKGNPVGGASVEMAPSNSSDGSLLPRGETKTDAQGAFSFATMAPRTHYSVSAHGPDGASGEASAFASEGETVRVPLTLSPPAVPGRQRLVVTVLREEDGRPLATALVGIGGAEPETPVDATGTAVFEDAAVGVAVTAGADGYRTEAETANRSAIVLRLREARSLRGRILRSDGTGAADVEVFASAPGSSTERSATSDSFGDILVDDLPSGPLDVHAEESRDGVHWIATAPAVAGAAGLVLRLAKDPATKTPTVVRVDLPDGSPAPVVDVRLWNRRESRSTSVSDGRLELPSDFSTVWIEVLTCYVSGRAVSGARMVGPLDPAALAGLVVRLPPPARLAGHVLGPGGEPIVGAMVRADPVRPGEFPDEGGEHGRARTAGDGTFQIDGVGDFDYLLGVRGPPRLAPAGDVRARGGDVGIEIRLAAGGERWVTVVDFAGTPVPGAYVRAKHPSEADVEAVADSAGRARLRGLNPTAAYGLEVRAHSRADVLPYDADRWIPQDARVVLPRALGVTGRLVDPQGRPVRGRVWDSSPDGNRSADTDADGRFALDGLPQGEIELGACVNEWTTVSHHRVTVPGENLTLVVDAGARLRFRPAPRPKSAVAYMLNRVGGKDRDRQRGETPADEEIVIPGMPADTPLLVYVETQSPPLVGLASGVVASDSAIPLTLTAPATITGRFRCASRSGHYEIGRLEVRFGGVTLQGVSDEFGQFSIEGLPPGTWLVTGRAWIDGGWKRGEARFEAGSKDVELDLK
jgi:protocatechuate 3,4-dioxygenase beta subunit